MVGSATWITGGGRFSTAVDNVLSRRTPARSRGTLPGDGHRAMLLLGRGAPAWQAATCVPTRGTCSGCCSRCARRASRRRSPGVTLTRVLPAGPAETPDGQLWVRPEAWCVIGVRRHGRAAPRLPAERRLVDVGAVEQFRPAPPSREFEPAPAAPTASGARSGRAPPGRPCPAAPRRRRRSTGRRAGSD